MLALVTLPFLLGAAATGFVGGWRPALAASGIGAALCFAALMLFVPEGPVPGPFPGWVVAGVTGLVWLVIGIAGGLLGAGLRWVVSRKAKAADG